VIYDFAVDSISIISIIIVIIMSRPFMKKAPRASPLIFPIFVWQCLVDVSQENG